MRKSCASCRKRSSAGRGCGVWETCWARGTRLWPLRSRWCVARERGVATISGRSGDRHALPAPAGHSRCDHRGDFAFGEAQHHHQESGRAGTDGEMHDADFRQDRDADVRPPGADGNPLRARESTKAMSFARRRAWSGIPSIRWRARFSRPLRERTFRSIPSWK